MAYDSFRLFAFFVATSVVYLPVQSCAAVFPEQHCSLKIGSPWKSNVVTMKTFG